MNGRMYRDKLDVKIERFAAPGRISFDLAVQGDLDIIEMHIELIIYPSR